MHRALLLAAAFMAVTASAEVLAAAPGDLNCELSSPPSEAKRIVTHGVDLLVFPPSIESSYTGCQVVWLAEGQRLSRTYYQAGEVQWFEAQQPGDEKPYLCQYKAALLVKEGASSKCPESFR
jgi:hypothetical protein